VTGRPICKSYSTSITVSPASASTRLCNYIGDLSFVVPLRKALLRAPSRPTAGVQSKNIIYTRTYRLDKSKIAARNATVACARAPSPTNIRRHIKGAVSFVSRPLSIHRMSSVSYRNQLCIVRWCLNFEAASYKARTELRSVREIENKVVDVPTLSAK